YKHMPNKYEGIQKYFEQLLQQRAEKHEHLRGRNNVTSCRSPTREFDTKLVKNVLQEKRHLEFLRRRSVSPEKSCVQSVKAGYRPSKKKRSAKTRSVKHQGPITEPDTMHTNIHMSPTPTGHPMMIPTPGKSVKSDDQITNTWCLYFETSSPLLPCFWQEALWREEVVKKKLISLQDTASTLLHSSNKIWTVSLLLCPSLALCFNQIPTFSFKFPKNGVKKLVLQMEEQKLVYEEKALAALQKATQEKTEALSKAETLQVKHLAFNPRLVFLDSF
uniref:Uncharacterized protein n=1 Tax=Myripristis murdjan TaxID=586833 RepID=A0A667WH37_9TELE